VRPSRPLVDDGLLIKVTRSSNDPQNLGKNKKSVNFQHEQSANPVTNNLKMIFESDEAILENNLRLRNQNLYQNQSSNFSDFKEEPKMPQEWSRSFSNNDKPQRSALPRAQLQKT